MAKTKNKSAVEKAVDKEQVAEVAVPNHADLRFKKDDTAELKEASVNAKLNVAELSDNRIRLRFNQQNLRS